MTSPIGVLALLLGLWPGAVSAGCGASPDPCRVPLGTYHLAMPPNAPEAPSAVMFLHGAGGTGMSALEGYGLAGTVLRRGYALIAPNGLERPGPFGTGWYFHPERPKERDEAAFLRQVRDDAVARFGLDATHMLLAGFSVGGSMASYVACDAPDDFAAYAPVAGSFWRPLPQTCAAPVKLLHTHGWRDRTVPLEGRPLGGGRIYQGDVWAAMAIWRATNGCDQLRADQFDTSGPFWTRRWTACAPGTALSFALHAGGHEVPAGWADLALDWFEGLDPTEP